MLTTVTGREIPCPDPIRVGHGSNRKVANDLKKVVHWLIDQALAEAESRKDEWMIFLFKGMNAKNFSAADEELTNVYLFGELYIFDKKENREKCKGDK